MSITFKPYFIECITNLHVGSGDANYGIVDKLVQRDTVTGFPTIHSSSLKGALREHFEQKWVAVFFINPSEMDNLMTDIRKECNKKVADRNFAFLDKKLILKTGEASTKKVEELLAAIEKLDSIFGKEGKGGTDSETGEYKFLSADLVALPVRCNFKNYVLGINHDMAADINQKAALFLGTSKQIFATAGEENALIIGQGNTLYHIENTLTQDVFAEDIELAKVKHTNPLKATGFNGFSAKYATFTSADFADINKNLPVIARNKLGENNNLWYEEVVPHKTVFITYIGVTNTNITEFETILKDELIQVGANASVGYGLCKFHAITI